MRREQRRRKSEVFLSLVSPLPVITEGAGLWNAVSVFLAFAVSACWDAATANRQIMSGMLPPEYCIATRFHFANFDVLTALVPAAA